MGKSNLDESGKSVDPDFFSQGCMADGNYQRVDISLPLTFYQIKRSKMEAEKTAELSGG
jgi:hypothetical protein